MEEEGSTGLLDGDGLLGAVVLNVRFLVKGNMAVFVFVGQNPSSSIVLCSLSVFQHIGPED